MLRSVTPRGAAPVRWRTGHRAFEGTGRRPHEAQRAAPVAQAAAPAAPPPPAAAAPLRVLVAEDTRVNQEVIRGLLEHRGHHPTVVPDGEEAVLAAQQNRYDLVLMDMQMPVLDGIGAAEPAVLMEKGRLLDRMGRPAEAFAAWSEGKRRLREATGQDYGAGEAADEAARLGGFFTPERRRLLPRAPVAPGAQPIFILGFPRSGTTLVEQTLSAHPAVAAGDELPLVGDLAAMVPRVLSSPLGYPEALADLLRAQGETVYTLGHIVPGEGVIYQGTLA